MIALMEDGILKREPQMISSSTVILETFPEDNQTFLN